MLDLTTPEYYKTNDTINCPGFLYEMLPSKTQVSRVRCSSVFGEFTKRDSYFQKVSYSIN